MARRSDGPVSPRYVEHLERQGGLSRLVAVLLSHGIDEHGDFNTGRLNKHLARMDHRDALSESAQVLKAAVHLPEYDRESLALVDAVLETYADHDADPLLNWLAIYAEEGTE